MGFQVISFLDLKEGQPVVALGHHVVSWDTERMGEPSYAIVPDDHLEVEVDQLRTAINAIYTLVGECLSPPANIFTGSIYMALGKIAGIIEDINNG